MPSDRDTPIFELKRQILAMCRRKGWGDKNGVQNEEFADVMMYGLQLADALHIDVTQQILRKIDIVDHRSPKPGEPKR